MFEAILYECRIELAYEGKRFDDCPPLDALRRRSLYKGTTYQTSDSDAQRRLYHHYR